MKIEIFAKSQEEFDEKREELLVKIAGDKYDIAVKKPIRRSKLEAQNEMMDYFDNKFIEMIKNIKNDVKQVLDVD